MPKAQGDAWDNCFSDSYPKSAKFDTIVTKI